MGDHRASVKIEFSMYGETKKCDMWINWSPNDYGVDERVIDFFEAAHRAMSAGYYAEVAKAQEAEDLIRREQQERQEYERLKARFENKG